MVNWGWNYGCFIKQKNIEVVSPGVFHYFHPKNLCQDHSGHHDIHLHMWKHDIGHKNHQSWSTEAEILVIFLGENLYIHCSLKNDHNSASVDQFWWFLWPKSCFNMGRWISQWPEWSRHRQLGLEWWKTHKIPLARTFLYTSV